MNNIYTHGQISLALHKALEKHKKELGKKDLPEKKIEWIKASALKLIRSLEKDMIAFNTDNPSQKIMGQDLATTFNTALNLVLKAIDGTKKK